MSIEGTANTEYASLSGKIRTFVVDKTLTISGACADAKATGEAIDSALDGALFEAKAVRKTGDTMTGNLTFSGQSTPLIIMQKPSSEDEGVIYPGKNNMCINSRNKRGDDTNRRALYIYNGTNATLDKALRILDVVDGVEKWYNIIHTGNLGTGDSARVVAGSYDGSGDGSKTLTFAFEPKLVIIQMLNSPSNRCICVAGTTETFGHEWNTSTDNEKTLSWDGNSMTISGYNGAKYTYLYVAIG